MPWSTEPSLSFARQGLAAAVCDAPNPGSGYRIYAIGGNDGTGPVATVEAYDTIAGSWSTIASLPAPREALAATSGPERLYAIGGDNGSAAVDTHEIFNPAGNVWASAPALPTARSGLAAVTGRDGLIYAVGGFNGAFVATLEVFDPAANAWTTSTSMPTGRSGLAAVTGPEGLIYAIGGQNGTGTLSTVEVFDPATSLWTSGLSLPAQRRFLAAAVGPDGLIYAYGGIDDSGIPQNTLYSYNPATAGPWVVQASLPAAQAFLAGATGPDGLIYAIGGQNLSAPALNTVEAFTVATTLTAPDPYIGNGTYQTPDIILLDPTDNPVPIGGAPGGAWDTLLIPSTNYGIQAVVYNDSTVAAPDTVVRFWQFPGGVGTLGTQIDVQTVTVPASGSIVVTSANPFKSGAPGEHECVAVSIANSKSLFFNVDPTTATAVIDPTVPHPAGSGHFGSAWRNTNSIILHLGGWRLPFQVKIAGNDNLRIKLAVTATKVPVGWDQTEEIVRLRSTLRNSGADLRLPLFLIPEIRAHLKVANLGLKIHLPGRQDEGVGSAGAVAVQATAVPGVGAEFTVSGTIPQDARTGDIFLLNVAAHYPATSQAREAVVEYLEVIYVKR
jgi:Kelch motif